MKNKKLKYILIPAVVLVWGTVFYKMFFSTVGDDDFIIPTNIVVNKTVKKDTIDEFTIIADYRDPFLDRKHRIVNNTQADYSSYNSYEEPRGDNAKNRAFRKKEVVNKTTRVKWPKLQYGGLVKNDNSGETIGVLNVNGNEDLVEKGDLFNSVEIIGLYNDSVVVKYSEELKTIIKE